MGSTQKQMRPPEHQNQQPGKESLMHPQPIVDDPDYRGSDKLEGKVAPSYVFLASKDATYITGQVLQPNGGRIVNG